jgi:hypothetical protein
MSQKSLAGYWELLALISCGVCIFTVGSLRQNGPKRLQQAAGAEADELIKKAQVGLRTAQLSFASKNYQHRRSAAVCRAL